MTRIRNDFPKLRRFGIGLLASSLVLILDQASKSFMIEFLTSQPREVAITPFFNLSLGFNPGISFGMLAELGPWGPIILSSQALIIIAILLHWLLRAEGVWECAAISMIIGGALGNVLDRVHTGAVTDFLDFHVDTYHWPAFNLADTGIFLGAGILVFRTLGSIKNQRETLPTKPR